MEFKSAKTIVEENFKGLDELIDDEDLLYFYKSLIATCLDGFAEQFIDLAADEAEIQCEGGCGLEEYSVDKQSILKLKELIK